jgi:ubiquinone/menaquinone biosynthesis C-methylase UbiE
MSSSDHIRQNVAHWTRINAEYTNDNAESAWAQDEIKWGMWQIPESELNALGEVAGLDVIDLGCGTGYFSAWLARRGARPVGVDPTPAQLETARRMQQATGIEFPLVEAAGEDTSLPDASFDVALSEYGASIWADPYKWIPEAARLLRPGGRLIFLRNSTLVSLCMDLDGITERLVRPLRGMNRIEWPDTQEVEFHLPTGKLVDVLRENGFEIDRLLELYAPKGAKTHRYYKWVTAEWARQWPNEELWVATKRG